MPEPEYQLSGTGEVDMWLARHTDPADRIAFLEWLPRLCADPYGVAEAKRERPGVPVLTAEVAELPCWVTYSVIEQYKAVHILSIDEPPSLVESDEPPPPDES